jgi:peptide/nickel transport system permease protein
MNRLLRKILRSPKALIGILIILTIILTAVFAPLLASHDPGAQEITKRLQPPSFTGGEGSHFLGTDSLGRDILSRIIYGSRISLVISVASVLGAGLIGAFFGVIAGYFGGRTDKVIMRLVDVQMAIPFLVLAMVVIAVLQPGLQNIIIVLVITGWVRYARITRAQTLMVKENEFVTAAVALGASSARIIRSDITPNILIPLIILATLEVGQMILAEAALSFLGLGVQPPTPTWGGMVADGRDYLSYAWWVPTLPGLAILITVMGINFFGDWVRDTFDPQLRNA